MRRSRCPPLPCPLLLSLDHRPTTFSLPPPTESRSNRATNMTFYLVAGIFLVSLHYSGLPSYGEVSTSYFGPLSNSQDVLTHKTISWLHSLLPCVTLSPIRYQLQSVSMYQEWKSVNQDPASRCRNYPSTLLSPICNVIVGIQNGL
jgi:hypothetical protein